MDILEYIKKYYCRNVKVGLQEHKSLSNLFEKVLRAFKVYPCKLTFSSSKKHYIIWDALFWEEFEKFYQDMLLMEFNVEKQEDIAIDNIASIIFRILSYETEDYPGVSLNLAASGLIRPLPDESKTLIYNIIENKLDPGEYLFDVNVAKLYVFFHEKTHIEYRTRNGIYRSDLDVILYYFKILLLCRKDPVLFKDFDDTLHEKLTHYFTLIVEEIEMFDENMNAQRTPEVEELLCDYYAFKDVFLHFKNNFTDLKAETILTRIFTGVNYVTAFQGLLKYQTVQWTSTLDYLDSLNGNYENIDKDIIADYHKKLERKRDNIVMRNAVATRLFYLECRLNHIDIDITGYFVSPIQYEHIFSQTTKKCSNYNAMCDLFLNNKSIEDKNTLYSFLLVKDKLLDF